jgi:hypothetical protein
MLTALLVLAALLLLLPAAFLLYVMAGGGLEVRGWMLPLMDASSSPVILGICTIGSALLWIWIFVRISRGGG